MPGGKLLDRIVSARRFEEADACGYVRSLLEAVAHLHSQKVVHRDITLENILMSSIDVNDQTIKVRQNTGIIKNPNGHAECNGRVCGCCRHVAAFFSRA